MIPHDKMLSEFLENIGSAIIIFDAAGVVTACNSTSEKMWGQVAGGLVGKSIADLDLHLVNVDGTPESKKGFPVNKIIPNSKKAIQLDFGLKFSSPPRTKWLRATLQSDFSVGGELSGVVLSLTEMTDLVVEKTTQSQIFLAKREWEATVDALQDIVTIQDTEMHIVRANKAAHDLFGYALGSLKGEKCFAVFHNRKIPCVQCPATRTGRDHCPHTGIVYNNILGKTFNVASFPIFDKAGNMCQTVHVARDISQSLHDETEKNRLMAAIDQASESVIIAGRAGEIQYVNPAFETISGYSRAEVIGRNPSFLKSGVHDQQFYESMWTALLNKQVWRGRLTNRGKNGTLFKEDVTISPVLDGAGEIINYVALKRDVTREDLLEQQLHQGMKMEALGTLAGGIAHDFNNILAAMIGYGEIAKNRLSSDHPARKDIDQVLASGDRAVDLVKQILTFSRRESYGQFRLFKVQYIIKEVLKLLRPSLPATIELVQEIDTSCRSILADPGQIYQVLMNLCTNAKQSVGDEHGCITIKLSETKAIGPLISKCCSEEEPGIFLDLEISDTGCGIAEDVLDKIFDPFFTTKTKTQGTGLGLAVVHGIIKKHKGEVSITSKVGVGTTVHVYLPTDGRKVVDKRVTRPMVQAGKERIMVVDDEQPVAEVLQVLLQKVGYHVTMFNSSIAAVQQFRLNPSCCDVVITDMLMPEMNGAELARECLSLRSDIPIIMLSGNSENLSRDKAKRLGIKELLLKPVKKERLYQIIRKVLEHG